MVRSKVMSMPGRRFVPWIFALAFAWLVLTALPAPVEVPLAGIDGSWRRALSMAYDQGLLFGRDITFTFGPLGCLLYPIPGLVDPFLGFIGGWAIYFLFVGGSALIWISAGNRLHVIAAWAALAGATILSPARFDKLQLAYLSLLAGVIARVAAQSRGRFLWLAIAGALAGVIPLVKTNEGVAACAAFYLLVICCYLVPLADRRGIYREFLPLLAIPPLAFVITFGVVESDLSALLSFVRRSGQIATGYSEAMSLPGPDSQVAVGLAGVGIFGLAVVLCAFLRRYLLPGLLPALAVAFFAFKSGLIRQDEWHTPQLPIKFAVVAALALMCARRAWERWLITAFMAGGLAYGIAWLPHPTDLKEAEKRAALLDTASLLDSNLKYRATWATLAVKNEQNLSPLQAEEAVAAAVREGTVDDVPSEIDIIEANHWRWQPRPIIQSYSAYAAELDQLNAAHLASRDSAEHIIMQWEDIDGRNPLLDDVASWRAIFDHYDVELMRPEFLVLKRRESPRYLEPRPIGTVTTTWHTDIDVPDSGPDGFTMMRVEVARSLYGSLRGALFRNSEMLLHVTFASHSATWYRVMRANLPNGALVSYLPVELPKVLPFFGKFDGPAPERVVSIAFENRGPREFADQIKVSWYTVALRKEPGKS